MQKLHEPRQRLYKKYVDVLTVMGKNEVLKPVAVLWDNGIKYEIDRVLQIRNKASSVGGCGLCYECVIQGQKRDLYFERRDNHDFQYSKNNRVCKKKCRSKKVLDREYGLCHP